MKKFSKGIITFNNVNDAVQNFENLYKNRKEIKILEKSNLDAYKKYFALYMKLGFLAGLILIILIV